MERHHILEDSVLSQAFDGTYYQPGQGWCWGPGVAERGPSPRSMQSSAGDRQADGSGLHLCCPVPGQWKAQQDTRGPWPVLGVSFLNV